MAHRTHLGMTERIARRLRQEIAGGCMGTRKRRTSCGQPQATANFPAHSRAASSSATSTTAKPQRCSLVSMNGPSVNSGVPLDASTLNTGAASSRPPVKMRTPGSLHLCHQRLESLGLLAQLLDRVVGHPFLVEGDEVLGQLLLRRDGRCGHPSPSPRTAAARFDTRSASVRSTAPVPARATSRASSGRDAGSGVTRSRHSLANRALGGQLRGTSHSFGSI
ncbi:MAG: hypothetical protein JWO57_3582 [Pseudonocardiales bacterium]|nr:hypothetical protein [Pseudonocardiales bacterium]